MPGDNFDQTLSNDEAYTRLCLGDTVAPYKFASALITAALAAAGSPTMAAAALADARAASFADQVNTRIGATSVDKSDRYEHWKALADRLRAGGPGDLPGGAGIGAPAVSATLTGASISEILGEESNTDLVKPSFNVGGDDIPGTDTDGLNHDDPYR